VSFELSGLLRHLRHQAKCGWLMARPDARQFYTILADDRIRALARDSTTPAFPLWLNLGYWEQATTLPEACAALAGLMGRLADLHPDHVVLDVGCGYAQPTVHWAETFALRRIVGLNMTPLQIAVARGVVRGRGLQDRVCLSLGSATRLPFADASFDRILALECAFHFDTRDAFFAEAHRVLRPGGRIAVADMLPAAGRAWNAPAKRLRRRVIAVPEANMYDRSVYGGRLASRGFADVAVRSIRDQVYLPFARCLALALQNRTAIEDAVLPLEDEGRSDEAGAAIWERYGLSDYVVASAVRA
jgi:microcystin synthetase protein McyJ